MVNLIGPSSQQDVELSALYRDATITYGEGNVLGILSTAGGYHQLSKRAVEEGPSDVDASTVPTNEQADGGRDERSEHFVYYPSESPYKILLYTKYAPVLINGSETIVLSDTKTTITTNKRSQNITTLRVRYNSKARQVSASMKVNKSCLQTCFNF